MAARSFAGRELILQKVILSTDDQTFECGIWIESDCWLGGPLPAEIGGFLDLPREELLALATGDRLVLRLGEAQEPYRAILDSVTGRFIGRRL